METLLQNRGRQVHAAGSFALDRYQGEERVQFRLTDIAPAEPFGGRGRRQRLLVAGFDAIQFVV